MCSSKEAVGRASRAATRHLRGNIARQILFIYISTYTEGFKRTQIQFLLRFQIALLLDGVEVDDCFAEFLHEPLLSFLATFRL